MNTKAKICPVCKNEYPEMIEFCICGTRLVFKGALEEVLGEAFASFKEGVDGKKD